MAQCKNCGSYAINRNQHGRDGTDPELCDVCFWRKRAAQAVAVNDRLLAVAKKIKSHLVCEVEIASETSIELDKAITAVEAAKGGV